MAKIGTIIGMVLLLGIGIAVAAEEMSTESWRYKMTVEVETPEGLKTGSAVREVILHKGIKMAPEQIADVELKGEAVAVDLGKRGMLLALMRGANHGVDYGTDIFFEVFPLNKRNEGKVILTPLQYPMFVRFRDQKDPKSMENITNMERADLHHEKYSLKGEVFGKDIFLKSVTIEVTNEPITDRLNKILPSFGPETGFAQWQKTLQYGDPLYLDRSDFIRR